MSTKNILVFTIVNEGYLPIAKNFIKRIKQLKMFEGMVFVCTDQESFEELNKEAHVCCYLQPNLNVTNEFVEWKDPHYTDLVFNKFEIKKNIIKQCRESGIKQALFIDTDIWIFKNFESQLIELLSNQYSYADLILQDGENYSTHPIPVNFQIKENQLIFDRQTERLCTGFILMKTTEQVESVFDYKKSEIDYTKFVGNQPFFNKQVSITKNIKVIPLERTLGLNGSLFNGDGGIERLSTTEAISLIETNANTAWFLHYTYVKGKNKISKMQEFNHWIL